MLSLIIGIPTTLGVAAFAPTLAKTFLNDHPDGSALIVAGSPQVLFMLIQQVIIGVYRGMNRFWTFALLSLAGGLAQLAFISAGFVVNGASTLVAVSAAVVGNAIMTIASVAVAWAHFGCVFRQMGRLWRRLVGFNFVGHLGTILQEVSYRLDIFIIAAFLTPSSVGIYSVAVSSAQLMWLLPNAIGTALLSRTASAPRDTADRRMVMVSQALMLIMSMLAVLAAVLAPILIPALYGHQFVGSVGVFLILMPGIVALGLWKTLANYMAGRGQPNYKMYGAVIGATSAVFFNLMLIPRFGIAGAAVASTLAYAATTAHLVHAVARETQITWRKIVFLEQETWQTVRSMIRRAARSSLSATRR